ncbi:hypothetical protein TKK_0004186 [Trichogramma kaykai]|uniref:Adenomatous polyposis coli protein n=1 Tax=Trichogramma kaykai TaxID=54128 RepID=A0ABD2XLB3_9HYME
MPGEADQQQLCSNSLTGQEKSVSRMQKISSNNNNNNYDSTSTLSDTKVAKTQENQFKLIMQQQQQRPQTSYVEGEMLLDVEGHLQIDNFAARNVDENVEKREQTPQAIDFSFLKSRAKSSTSFGIKTNSAEENDCSNFSSQTKDFLTVGADFILSSSMWTSTQSPTSSQLSQLNSPAHNELVSMMSFSTGGESTPVSSAHGHKRLNSKMDVIYNLLSMLGSTEGREDMSATLLTMSNSTESCNVMRQSGCLPLLIQLIHAPGQNPKTREQACKALFNIVHAKGDERSNKREARVLRLLEQLRDYCQTVRISLSSVPSSMSELEHPSTTIAALMKLSFDEAHRFAMCQLGGLHAVAELVETDHDAHGTNSDDQNCITLRRYSGMALTNLTFGDSNNKALLCSFQQFMKALVSQLKSPSDDLRQVTASVLRNLSWRADSSSKQVLREVGAVVGLMKAAMEARKEATLKSILSALWNLSAHCTTNKIDICAVDGALAFLVDMLSYNAPSKNLTIVENAGGILRNVSSHIAIRNDYRAIVRERGCLQVLLRQLRSQSLTVVSNACGTLWNLSARNPQDQLLLWDLGAVPMLRNLIHSKHKMISMGSSAALKNLLSASPNGNNFLRMDSTVRGLGLQTLPTLVARRQKALAQEIDQNLSETYDNIEPSSSPVHKEENAPLRIDESFLQDQKKNELQSFAHDQQSSLGLQILNNFPSENQELMRSVTSTQSDTVSEKVNRQTNDGATFLDLNSNRQSTSMFSCANSDSSTSTIGRSINRSEKKYTLRYMNVMPERMKPGEPLPDLRNITRDSSAILWTPGFNQGANSTSNLPNNHSKDNASMLTTTCESPSLKKNKKSESVSRIPSASKNKSIPINLSLKTYQKGFTGNSNYNFKHHNRISDEDELNSGYSVKKEQRQDTSRVQTVQNVEVAKPRGIPVIKSTYKQNSTRNAKHDVNAFASAVYDNNLLEENKLETPNCSKGDGNLDLLGIKTHTKSSNEHDDHQSHKARSSKNKNYEVDSCLESNLVRYKTNASLNDIEVNFDSNDVAPTKDSKPHFAYNQEQTNGDKNKCNDCYFSDETYTLQENTSGGVKNTSHLSTAESGTFNPWKSCNKDKTMLNLREHEITNKFEDKYRREHDPEAMIASLDRLTATLVKQSEAMRFDRETNNGMKSSILSTDTWNEDSPSDASFPSLSVSAPLVASFRSDDFSASEAGMHTSDSKTEQKSPKRSEAMIAGKESVSLNQIDDIKPPSLMDSLLSLTASYGPSSDIDNIDKNRITQLPQFNRKKSLPIGAVAHRAMCNAQNRANSLENFSNECKNGSQLENIKPPSLMDEILDINELENSLVNVASITSDIADISNASFAGPVNFDLSKPFSNTSMAKYSYTNQMGSNNSLTECLDRINPPSLMNEITRIEDMTIEDDTNSRQDTLCFDSEFNTDDVTQCAIDEHVDDCATDSSEIDGAFSGEFGDSQGSTVSQQTHQLDSGKQLTPKEKRHLIKERYKTYTIGDEITKTESTNDSLDPTEIEIKPADTNGKLSPFSKLTPKQRRKEDRSRFETKVLSNACTELIETSNVEETKEQVSQQKLIKSRIGIPMYRRLDKVRNQTVAYDVDNERVSEADDTKLQNCQYESDDSSSSMENQVEVENASRKPRIVKPSPTRPPLITEQVDEAEAKGIRGRRKPLYSSQRKSTVQQCTYQQLQSPSSPHHGVVRSSSSPLVRPTRTLQLRQHNSIEKSQSASKIGQSVKKINNQPRTPSTPTRQQSPKLRPLERQGTFTKDEPQMENTPTIVPCSPLRFIPTAITRPGSLGNSGRSFGQVSPRTSPFHSAKLKKAGLRDTPQKSLGAITSSNSTPSTPTGIPSIVKRSSSNLSAKSTLKYSMAGQPTSLQNTALRNQTVGSRSSSSISIASDSVTRNKASVKETTSKIASLWKKVEQNRNKQQQNKPDTRQWITGNKGATHYGDTMEKSNDAHKKLPYSSTTKVTSV